MKTKLLVALLAIIVIGIVVWGKQGAKTPVETVSKPEVAIRSFMAEPNLELIYLGNGLPQPYFMVGKVSKLEKGGGFSLEKMAQWERRVDIYEQKDLISGQCAVYEYHADSRNDTLTQVRIRNLRQSEIDALKNSSVTCGSNKMPKLTKPEAETLSLDYLMRALPNFDQIKDQLVYSQKLGGESHEWRWEDKSFKLPEGLGGDPYPYPIVRIVIYGDKSILFENTTSLFL